MSESQLMIIEQLQDENKRLRLSLEDCYMLARRKRTVTYHYDSGKRVPEGPRSDDTDWDHIVRFCERAGLKPSILRATSAGD